MPPKKGKNPVKEAAAAAKQSAETKQDGKNKAKSGEIDAVYGIKQTGKAGGHATGSSRELDGVYRPVSKKAVRANAGIVLSRPAREVGGVVVKEWQRLPRQLLFEYCQKQKRPRPFFPKAHCSEPDKHRVRVVLPDPKGKKEKDITLCPEQNFSSVQEAEEYAALLGLFNLTPSLPLEKKFPEPYASAWLSMNSEKPELTATSRFLSKAEQVQHEEDKRLVRVTKERQKEARARSENKHAPVFMSDGIRKFVEDIIRMLSQLAPADQPRKQLAAISGSDGETSSSSAGEVDTEQLTKLCAELAKLGFNDKDAKTAANQALSTEQTGSKLDVALDWLCLNLPEHRLPKRFDPRGKQFEVVFNQSAADVVSAHLGAGRMGFPAPVCEAAVKAAGGQLEPALLSLFRALYAALPGAPAEDTVDVTDKATVASSSAAKSTTADDAATLSEIAEEQVALESIFDKEFKRIGERSWSVQLSEKLGSLEFLVPVGCRYPHELPVICLRNASLSAQQRLHIVQSLAAHVYAQQLLGSAMTYELCSFAQSNMEEMLKADPLPTPVSWKLNEKGALSDEKKAKLVAGPKERQSDRGRGKQRGGRGRGRGKGQEAWSEQVQPSDKADDSDKATATDEGETKADTAMRERSERPEKVLRRNPRLDQSLLEEQQTKMKTAEYKAMAADREKLPAAKERARIVELVEKNQVVVISGATGCGKSTQVPQFLLDAWLESKRGSLCNIVCTQPRRISAIGLADRVAAERVEKIGESVGYRIRGEAKVSGKTRLAYVTTGVLLRQLTSAKRLESVSHVIIDEVHERTVEIDFLLIIMRQLLAQRPNLKLILMSATLEAKVFTSYFGGCPMVEIPGRTFPVKEHFLADIIEATSFEPDHTFRKQLKPDEMKAQLDAVRSATGAEYSDKTLEIVATINPERINLPLAEATIWHILQKYDQGGILVFLPGLYEITKLHGMVKRNMRDRGWREDKLWLIPLHGSLSTANQQRVFARTPSGVRKVVLATNIAETSITVNDVVFVVDSGKMRENQYDAERKMALLAEAWVSKANATQRKGRAGRVQAGHCFRLFTQSKFDSLPDHQLPELHRTPLDHVCLQIKLLGLEPSRQSSPGCIAHVLSQAPQPPSPAAIKAAITELQTLNALTADEQLTPLGRHLARLPVSNVRIGKMLIYGAMLSCVTPVVNVAALLSTRSPWLAPMEKRDEAEAARAKFTVQKSDHLTLLNAFNAYCAQKAKGFRHGEEFCTENFLHAGSMREAHTMTTQYLSALADIGFLHSDSTRGKAVSERDNENASNNQVISAAICAGLYPNVVSVRMPNETFIKTINGSVPVASEAKEIRFYTRQDNERMRVFLHPRSVNFSTVQYESPWLVYLQLMHTAKAYIHDCTMCWPYALLLFGGEIGVDHEKGLVIVDKWIKFHSPGTKLAVLVRELRRHLDDLLLRKSQNPALDISRQSSPVIEAILRLLTTNGFETAMPPSAPTATATATADRDLDARS